MRRTVSKNNVIISILICNNVGIKINDFTDIYSLKEFIESNCIEDININIAENLNDNQENIIVFQRDYEFDYTYEINFSDKKCCDKIIDIQELKNVITCNNVCSTIGNNIIKYQKEFVTNYVNLNDIKYISHNKFNHIIILDNHRVIESDDELFDKLVEFIESFMALKRGVNL